MFYVIDEYNVRFSEDRTILIKAPDSLDGEYQVPDSVVAIEKAAFSHCEKLETIVLPPSLHSLGENIFAGCKKLRSVVFNSPITQIGDWCFAECESLETIDIPLTTEHVGGKSFYNCKSLKKIVIPDNCLCDRCTFEGCESLCDINIPDCWEEIPYACFCACIGLEHVIVPSSVKKIGEAAFAYCSSLVTVDIGDGVEKLEDKVFEYCEEIREIRFGLNLKYVGNKCFAGCFPQIIFWDSIDCHDFDDESIPFPSSVRYFHFGHYVKKIPDYLCYGLDLEDLAIPDSVESIGESAFCKCNPKYIHLNKNITPQSLEDIFGMHPDEHDFVDSELSRNIFYYCDRIEKISVSIHNPYYASKGGNLYNKDFSKIIKIGRNDGRGRLYIQTKEIDNFAGMGLDITDLTISGCTKIGKFAFYDCQNLKTVSFEDPDNCAEGFGLNSFAFGNCPKLEEIYWDIEDGSFPISDSQQVRGWLCGEECHNGTRKYDFSYQIHKITIGKHISKLPTFMARLLNVSELQLPANIIEVEGSIPPNLTKLSIEQDIANNNQNFTYSQGFLLDKSECVLIRYIGDDDEITVPNGVKIIASHALSHTKARKINLPDSITTIGESAFENSNIETFAAPDCLEVIEQYAFRKCRSLVAVTFNPSLKHIQYGAFQWCVKLSRLSIPKSTKADGDIIVGCSSLTELEIEDIHFDLTGLTSLHRIIWDCIGVYNRWHNIFAKEVTYYSSYEKKIYYDNENSVAHQIESIVLTDKVEYIPKDFAKCMQITEVDIPQSVKHIGEEAFYYCQKLEKIILHSMDIEVEEDFCHFNMTRIQLYQEYVDCTPTKIFFEGKDVTDIFIKKNKEIIDERRREEADAADFEQYLKDSYNGAYEGEWDPNGDLL